MRRSAPRLARRLPRGSRAGVRGAVVGARHSAPPRLGGHTARGGADTRPAGRHRGKLRAAGARPQAAVDPAAAAACGPGSSLNAPRAAEREANTAVGGSSRAAAAGGPLRLGDAGADHPALPSPRMSRRRRTPAPARKTAAVVAPSSRRSAARLRRRRRLFARGASLWTRGRALRVQRHRL